MVTNIPVAANLTYSEKANFSSFSVKFPNTPYVHEDIKLVSAELIQVAEEHDRLVLQFKGRPNDKETALAYGDPVEFTFSNYKTPYTFNGHVYSIDPQNTPQANNLTVVCISASGFLLKNTDQAIYPNVTADQVVAKIAKKNGLKAITQRHPRVRAGIAHAGQSDWQLLRRLAKQTGFALRAENTTIFFMSKSKIFSSKKDSAPYFYYVDAPEVGTTTKPERAYSSIFYFYPYIADNAAELGARVDRVITGLNEKTGEIIETLHKAKDFVEETKGVVIPGEDYFL